MECMFQVGDKVQVRRNHKDLVPPGIKTSKAIISAKAIYTVRDIEDVRGTIAIRLIEIVQPKGDYVGGFVEPLFLASQFERVVDTTATVAALARAMREAMKKGRIDA